MRPDDLPPPSFDLAPPASSAPGWVPMSSAWWIVYGVAFAVAVVLYAYLLIPQPGRSWDAMSRGIARILLDLASAGGFALLALAAVPGALAGHGGQWRFVVASLLAAGTWGLLAMMED